MLGSSRDRLALLLQDGGEPAYRAGQIFRWIHRRRAHSFAAMTDLPAGLRARLAARFDLARPAVEDRWEGADGTVKHLLLLADGATVESVRMREGARTTLCLSSQVGCRFGCTFCATATMGLARQLTSAEIVAQAMLLAEDGQMATGTPFNVVFMGMGEPMDNLDAVLEAFDVLTDPDGFGLSWRRITLSTAGHVDGIARLGARQTRPRLAVSLNASDDAQRSRLMPINRRWNIEDLRGAVAAFPTRPGERVTFEYVLLAGETDRPGDVARLSRLMHGLPARLNLIPWNRHPGLPHARPDDLNIMAFRDSLLRKGIDVSVRHSRGQDGAAACGQLATPSRARSRKERI